MNDHRVSGYSEIGGSGGSASGWRSVWPSNVREMICFKYLFHYVETNQIERSSDGMFCWETDDIVLNDLTVVECPTHMGTCAWTDWINRENGVCRKLFNRL